MPQPVNMPTAKPGPKFHPQEPHRGRRKLILSSELHMSSVTHIHTHAHMEKLLPLQCSKMGHLETKMWQRYLYFQSPELSHISLCSGTVLPQDQAIRLVMLILVLLF